MLEVLKQIAIQGTEIIKLIWPVFVILVVGLLLLWPDKKEEK
jgi:hypothetical protein